ncbi:MAG: hypothetical protein WBN40_05895 [Pseudomonadales bacterium]
MKKAYVIVFTSIFVLSPVFAEKPEWAGKGKPTMEKKEAHQAAMEAKEESDNLEEERKKISKQKQEKLKGLEKQKEKKSEQVQKEMEKGSEKGQEARESRKKWWKFWGE